MITVKELNDAWAFFSENKKLMNLRFGQYIYNKYPLLTTEVYYVLDDCLAYNMVYEDILK